MEKHHFLGTYLFLQIVSFLLLLQKPFRPEFVLVILLSLILLFPTLFIKKRLGQVLTLVIFYIVSFYFPHLSYFLPGVWYMVNRKELLPIHWIVVGSLAIICFDVSILNCFFLIFLVLFGYYLSNLRLTHIRLSQDFLALKDDSWEKEQRLRRQHEEVIESQEAVLKLEIAEERNRIARDIHDNVGHLLSSAIIQLGALEVVNKAEELQQPLYQLKETVHTGMDKIRESVHDLHQESLQFHEGLAMILGDFHFCPIKVQGDLSQHLNNEQSRILLMIIKECLSNVMRHSNATEVIIEQTELPAFYRCRILDNGTVFKEGTGLGLFSMRQRIDEIGGQLHINATDKGFVVSVILPKNKKRAEGNS
ncbi:hypothetical protein BAU17_01925 [Enterococcus sp. CU12B]|uniref:histidine kinase n=2 Tax=Candidatus Enterococcus willemsii TaxID=1857215 RepID=A0ABQ6YXT8_9ENTE|nr:hypothetical protein BAU17_01925 [Enterococcus sp. CU12B]